MVIAINGYEAVVPRFGYSKLGLPNRVGSSAYCFELLVSLSKIDKKNNYLIFLPKAPTDDMPAESVNWKYKVIPARKLWTLTSLSLDLLKSKSAIDIFFSPTHYLPFSSPSKNVISILDVSYLHFPNLFKQKDLYQLKIWGKFSIKKAKKIITISKSSKSDIIKEYGVSPNKVVVVYPGVKEISNLPAGKAGIKYQTCLPARQVSNMDELRKKFGIEKKYILFVGTLQPRKNIVRLIEAFSILIRGPVSLLPRPTSSLATLPAGARRGSPALTTPQDYSDLQLVIVGKRGWQFEEILNAPKKFGVEKNVKFLSDVGDEELPSIYKNAEMFVLPSLYEGFGLPVLEAMKYGCPVIASNVSSLPEAGGDAALYVDPNSTEDIAEQMRKLMEDDNLREQLVKKGYEQVKKFSWEKSARETLKVLEEVASNG